MIGVQQPPPEYPLAVPPLARTGAAPINLSAFARSKRQGEERRRTHPAYRAHGLNLHLNRAVRHLTLNALISAFRVHCGLGPQLFEHPLGDERLNGMRCIANKP
jgi:hypothetical protein